MITIRKAEDRGPSNLGWLNSKHTFSFGHYYDAQHMGFESLRVINDDRVKAGTGFGSHAHDNMEIISYVLSGALEHKDSMGNGSVIKPGEVQLLTAGSGITHSEYNHSKTDDVHFLQIWFIPNKQNLTPSYDQKYFNNTLKRNQFCLVVSADGRNGSMKINQNIDMSVALFNGNETASYILAGNHKAWVHIARGNVTMNGHKLKSGDGAAVKRTSDLHFTNGNNAEVIIFDMAIENI